MPENILGKKKHNQSEILGTERLALLTKIAFNKHTNIRQINDG